MSPEEKEKQATEFLAKVASSIPYFLDNEILDSFDVKFEYRGKRYQLALIENGKVNGDGFELFLN